jgi:hypothetical protein
MDVSYFLFYYIAAALGLVCSPLFFLKYRGDSLIEIRFFVILVVSFTYLVGALRQNGVDYAGYIYSYYNDYAYIPDIGFQAVMFFFNSAGLPFQAMMLFIATSTIFSLRSAAKYFGISFIPLLTLYFLHLAVVRDFSQIRVGFAVALAILGLTSSGKLKRGVFYLLAGSIHLTSLVFILSYEFCRWAVQFKSRRSQIMVMVCAVVCIFFLGSFVQYLSFIDERIEIYLTWEDENYGLPVGQYLTLIFQISILAMAYYSRMLWEQDEKIRVLVFLQILGISIFLAFIDIAIFAFRLSNVTLSIYPVLLISILARLRLRVDGYLFSNTLAVFVWLLVGIALIFRSDSVEILKAVSFGN